ncbi:hypothetical protein Acsp04_28500 [Actinomadura sp. NBRC 104425]|uniref:hypothetical protein n=1 Tax=Actinomadura sp. NBRC 104425 TaxID=3032204 RepID=UPI0024A4DCDB|nr:hypothetical protein [Actinomadura sp. NBRC 104425]GLZ12615.1 hypothetical protein Acsp04_28500 [Actinomadura sp. NBRC 104425]
MSETRVTVYVPCDVVEVQVRVGYGDSLSSMEELVLRAVHAGLNDVAQLSTALGLPRRLVNDFVYDLWRHDHLVIDPARRTVVVSDEVARHLDAGEPERLRGAEATPETLELMVDKLTGLVRAAAGPMRPGNWRMTVPVEDSDFRLQDAREADVLAALNAAQRRRRGDDAAEEGRAGASVTGRTRRVRSFRIPPRDLQQSAGRRWTPLQVAPVWDEDSERLVVTVTDETYPAELREPASERLTRLAAEFPTKPVFVELRRLAEARLVEPPSAESVLTRLEQRVTGTVDIPAGQRLNWHDELTAEADRLDRLLRARVDRELPAQVVPGDAHPETVVGLIRQARTQLVIAGPWLTYGAISTVLDELDRAADRGVVIVLLWGADRDSLLEDQDDKVRNALYDLKADRPGGPRRRVVIPETSVGTHAKVLLADDRAALVTSRNLLSSSGGLAEVGVLLRARGPGQCAPIEELLRWARRSVPSYDQAQLLTVRHADFVAAARLHGEEPDDPEPLDEPPAANVDPPDEDQAVAPASVRIWAEGWQAHLRQCRDFLSSRALPDVRVVTDATHRDLLWVALRRAARRLVIASDGASAEVIDDRFVNALRGCLDRGVATTLVYGGRNARGRAKALARLEALRGDYPGLLTLIGPEAGNGRDNHAKVLVWDDDAVVGSFNYLSFEGRYGRQRPASELSVRLTGQEAADAVATAVGAARVPRPADRPTTGPAAPSGAAYAAAQRIIAGYRADAPLAELVRDVLAAAPDPWQVLDALTEDAPAGETAADDSLAGDVPDAAAPRDLLRVVAARCLADHRDRTDEAVSARWLTWLIRDRWQEGAFVEAAVLRRTLPDRSAAPTAALALLGAARGTPDFPQVLDDFVVEDLRPAERIVGVAAAAAGTLLGPVADTDPLDVVADGLVAAASTAWTEDDAEAWAGVWADFAAQVHAYWHGDGQRPGAYQAVPLDVMRAALGGAELERSRAEAWRILDRLLRHAAASNFNHTVSNRTHHSLFDEATGEFARLRRILDERADADAASLPAAERDARAAEALRDWLDALPTLDMADFVTAASAKVLRKQYTPMQGSHLRSYVQRLDPVVQQVRHIVEDHGRADTAEAAALPGETAELARWLAGAWPSLEDSAARLPAAEARLAREFLTDLEDLMRWGADHG